MLFINHGKNAQAAKDYFRDQLTRSDYYMKEGQEVVGQWHGLGAQLLELSGSVDHDSYFRLCDNQDPKTGEQLTARMKAGRRVAYDFTFDCPKEISLAYELGGDTRIVEALRASVRETMAEAERDMRVRVRKNGQNHDRVSANMVWAEFLHRTTRPLADGVPDPQLHIHAVALNLSYDPEEACWKAGEFGSIKSNANYYQSAFHARLGRKLSDLGYQVERDRKSFRLVGIERTLTDRFSRRTKLIEAEAERRKITDPKKKAELGRLTRKAKGQEASIEELRTLWKSRISPDELRTIKDASNRAGNGAEITAKVAMDHAAEHSFERKSVVPEKHLLSEALMHGVGSVVPEDLRGELARADVILEDAAGIRYATTKQVHREEIAMVDFVRSGRGTCKRLGSPDVALDPSLSREQRKAADAILRSRDRVIGLRGAAGTGKTRLMQATVAAIEKGGRKVYAFAPSAEASRGVLRREGFANADTVERLLTDEKLQRQVAGQVLWCDEAGLLSVKDANRLFTVAKAQNCRVILAGDTRQHASVARGDALRLIEKESGLRFAELKEVRRQTDAAYRDAVSAISEGETPAKNGKTQLQVGIEKLDAMGAVIETEGDERFRLIAGDYLDAVASRKKDGSYKSALVVTPTHAEGAKVTEEIRHGLKARGRLTGAERNLPVLSSLNLTTAERREAVNYQPEMVVQFHQNAKGFARGEKAAVVRRDGASVYVRHSTGKEASLPLADAERFQVYQTGTLGLSVGDTVRITQNGYTRETRRTGREAKSRLNNGALYEVAGFTKAGDITLANGFVVPKDYGHLAYGYTSTSNASQGKTVDRVLISMGSDSLAAVHRESFYVSVSRGREGIRLYTDDRSALFEAVQPSGARLSATELLRGQAPKPRPSRLSRLVDMQRVRRTYEAIRDRSRGAYDWMRGKEQGYGTRA